jgi:hypothetical protein
MPAMRPIALMMLMSMLVAGYAAAQGSWETTTSGCKVWLDDPHPDKTITWSGSCSEGRASGKGILVWSLMLGGKPVESRYEGRMRDGDIAGTATYAWGNGNRYEGRFFEGVMEDDDGIYEWANGNRYEGAFTRGEENGRGVHDWANGNNYAGEFKNGVIEGRGIHVWANGDRYQGEFRGGLMDGEGVYVWASGRRLEGRFREGKPAQ